MKNNIKRNLLIGFSSSLIILVATSLASYISITNLQESTNWVNHTYKVLIELEVINSALVDAETNQRGYLLSIDQEYLEPYKLAVAKINTSFSTVKELTADNPAHQQSLAELRKLIDERLAFLGVSVEAKQKGEEVKVENLRAGKAAMETVREIIMDMKDRESELMAIRTESLSLFAGFTRPLILFGSVIAVIITILFYARVNGDVQEKQILQEELEQKDADLSARLGIIREIADKISQGSYDTRVDDKQGDVLGDVAGSLNKMAGSLSYSFDLLSVKEWLQAGLASLNDIMIGEKPLEDLAREVIDFLATYTNSQVACLYVYDAETLHAIAGYAYVPGKERERFKVGEGLVGQAAQSGKVIEWKEVPEETIYLKFTSGEAKPKHVIAIPLKDGRTLKGVIELATVHQFSEKEVEFMTAAASNIGIAIGTAQNRKRLQELLEETQSQSEELKAQHSDLENLNSELEVQAEKLQASEEELKVQQEELKQANLELEERSRLLEESNVMITERNIEIQGQSESLAKSARYKSEFLANMSHELRTPLNSILLLSRLMSDNQEKNLTEDQIEYARVIQGAGHGLLSLIDEILDLSKIEAGKMQLEYQQVPVGEVVQDMISLFSAVAAEKNIEFRTEIGIGVPEFIESDKLRIEQVIRNLLSNAIKFTAKGYVSLQVEKEKDVRDFVTVTVKDTGIGIPKEKLGLVFEAFQQADGSTRRKYGGTGLGLSISKELMKLLGGDITVVSEVGQGSAFIVKIPVSKIAAQNIKAVQSEREKIILPEEVIVAQPDRKFVTTLIPENIPDDRGDVRAGDKVILIVEDDVHFAKSLLNYTRSKSYKGVVAVRGDEGIALAKQFKPLGILLDIQLPIKSGWEVMEELKGNPETRHIPVHIMSSYELKKESLLKGAVDFINKPLAADQIQEVFRKIEHVLSHHPKKVLIVEENARHAKALAYFLETFDVNIEMANELDSAISSLKSSGIDCVILDMGIPGMISYEMLERVKQQPGLENLPIIIFTGKNLSQTEELRIKQYADSIVVKTAHSYKRILDEVSLFLHLMEKSDPKESTASRYHKLGALDEVLKDKTVLIADDDMRNIFSMTKALEKYKMNVIAAVDGRDALRKLRENPSVDIVLMDMMMPEMDGYESTSAIRKDKKFKDLPIIAVTAKAMMGDREKCINAGASDYISKPVDVDQLFSLLRVWLYERNKK